jgi:hypothetical protein
MDKTVEVIALYASATQNNMAVSLQCRCGTRAAFSEASAGGIHTNG